MTEWCGGVSDDECALLQQHERTGRPLAAYSLCNAWKTAWIEL